jgi:hypothetical protein
LPEIRNTRRFQIAKESSCLSVVILKMEMARASVGGWMRAGLDVIVLLIIPP